MKIFLLLLVLIIFGSVVLSATDSKAAWRGSRHSGDYGLPEIFSEPLPNDRAIDIADQFLYSSLPSIAGANLEFSTLAEQPWSDSYWPIYQGGIAQRYNDPDFPARVDWKKNSEYLEAHLGLGPVEVWSPAEKYDKLVGDSDWSLSRKAILEGRYYYERQGRVATWMGICHGWAPASFILPRPTHSIVALAADGVTQIPFYPSDLKALASLLYANGRFSNQFVGGRCNEKEPELDPMGRPIKQECLDNNPATWHLAVINQIGVSKRSLVFDAAFDQEVWNHPLYSYKIKYFNPMTLAPAENYEAAKVLRSEFTMDPRAGARSLRAKWIVGIIMEYQYAVETQPSSVAEDSPAQDVILSNESRYDLEIDSQERIIGGEWQDVSHPDFIWVPRLNTVVHTFGDDTLDRQNDRSTWGLNAPVPGAWRAPAKQSSNMGQPLRRIVLDLLGKAQLVQ